VKDWVLLGARLTLATCLLPAATAHAFNLSGLALSFWMKGMPLSHGVAAACATAELFGVLALALGIAPRLTVSAVAASLVVTTGTLHRFWDVAGPGRALEQAAFVAGAATLAGLALYAVTGPGAWSWQAFWKPVKAPPPEAAKKKPSRPRKPRPKPTGDEEEVPAAA
jgi:uncharacterized membrane protein YphA (DoxX/SURF4 family)